MLRKFLTDEEKEETAERCQQYSQRRHQADPVRDLPHGHKEEAESNFSAMDRSSKSGEVPGVKPSMKPPGRWLTPGSRQEEVLEEVSEEDTERTPARRPVTFRTSTMTLISEKRKADAEETVSFRTSNEEEDRPSPQGAARASGISFKRAPKILSVDEIFAKGPTLNGTVRNVRVVKQSTQFFSNILTKFE